jgi:regulator of protease activity HflC (stomatin/prohibitin superfamily)
MNAPGDKLDSTPRPEPAGPPPPPPPGPIAQSVTIGFRTVYVAMLLLAVYWLSSNVREIAPDTQAVVLRFGRVVRAQQAGLLMALPRPIEEVRLLPGPDRQLSQDVAVLPSESEKAHALITSSDSALAPPGNVAPYLTGDGNVVLLNATLIYRINDPIAYVLSQTHVSAALDRLFRATTVRVTAGGNLNDFLVVPTTTDQADQGGTGGQPAIALRTEVRSGLLATMNSRLTQLANVGASLGIEVQRIDMTAWLPPDAKVAFDEVLTATQAADRGVAIARTDAEHKRQEAERERDRLLSAAQATAAELVSTANVDTASILALEREETPQTRGSLLQRAYRADIGDIMNRIGSGILIDPQSGVRFVLPGKQK